MVDGADQVRFIQHGVVENRICASEPSQRGRAEVVFEAKKNPGGTPAARRRLAGSFAFCSNLREGGLYTPKAMLWQLLYM